MRRTELFILSVMVFVTVVLWVIYDLYLNKRQEFEFLQEVPQEINVEFDADVFNKLKKKEIYE